MAKSYTDIEQSKKLAEILPIASADMFYRNNGIDVKLMWEHNAQKVKYPCWSLAVLLEILPEEITDDNGYKTYLDIRKYDSKYQIAYYTSLNWSDTIVTDEYENLVDACVDMILKLHELNLL